VQAKRKMKKIQIKFSMASKSAHQNNIMPKNLRFAQKYLQ